MRPKAREVWLPSLIFGLVVTGLFLYFWYKIYSLSSVLFFAMSCPFFHWYFVRKDTMTHNTAKSMVEEDREEVLVVIIGAGCSGLCSAVKLKEAGIKFVIYEKYERVGGTWFENTYPGCACDIMGHLYSFSFYPNPDWSRTFPAKSEILTYLENVCSHYGLYPSIKLNTKVDKCMFDDVNKKWIVHTDNGEKTSCNFIISGTGPLNIPKFPDIKGREEFGGKIMHTAQWDNKFDLRYKRVAVIGTGCSAIQVVPSIAPEVDELYVFQRTPAWIAERPDFQVPSFLRCVFKYFPLVLKLHRWFLFAKQESLYYAAFTRGTKRTLPLKEQIAKFMKDSIDDPDLARQLIPDYEIGCKRVTVSNDYLTSFNRANVSLVTQPIERITETGIVTRTPVCSNETKNQDVVDGGNEHMNVKEEADYKDQEFQVDVVLYATGYNVLKCYKSIPVLRPSDNKFLSEVWGEIPSAYLGIMVPGFPNVFITLGPNTVLGHNSVVWMVECQVNYIVKAIKETIFKKAKTIEVKQSAFDTFQDYLHLKMKRRVFAEGCTSWYQNASGFVYALWPSHCINYWWQTLSVNFNDFEIR